MEVDDSTHQCPYCELSFPYATALRDHVRSHHRNRSEAFEAVHISELPPAGPPV